MTSILKLRKLSQERVSNSAKATEIGMDGTGVKTKAAWLQSLCS